MTRREALRIVRLIIKAYEAGDSDDTLAFYLQREIEADRERVRQLIHDMRQQ